MEGVLRLMDDAGLDSLTDLSQDMRLAIAPLRAGDGGP